MSNKIATYISLPGTTGEAMEHWHEVLGGELQVLRYGDMPPMPDMPGTPDPQAVAHATLVTPGGAIIAGGELNQPFEEAPWGGWYGQVFDRFGVMWAFSCE